MSDLKKRWKEIQDTRPKTANGEAKPGTVGTAYLKWQHGMVERIRILSRDTNGIINYQRLTSSARGSAKLEDLRSGVEIVAHVRQHHPDHMPKDIKKFDATRLPKAVVVEIWSADD